MNVNVSKNVLNITVGETSLKLLTSAVVNVDGDADTLQGENGAYYLDRANHTGEQAQSTITGLIDALASLEQADANLQGQITDVQTLAQTNQLNLGSKADQVDLDATNVQVETNRLAILTKADTTALETSVANRVRFDTNNQGLSSLQKANARTNIGAEAAGTAAALVAAITPAAIGAATAVQGAKADTALQSADLAPVAFSGDYSALTGLPSIPDLSSSTPAAPTSDGTAGTATTAARGDHAHPLPTSAQITAAVLTGLASGSATDIAAADTLLAALAKLQAQATANAGLLASVYRRMGASWYISGGWYDVEYPRFSGASGAIVTLGRVFYIPRQILETANFTSLAFNCSTGATRAVVYAGIYSDNNGQPDTLLASFSADCSTSGVKSAAISLTLSAGQIVWDAFLMVGGSAQVFRHLVTRVLPDQTLGADANPATYRLKSGQSDLAATATGTTVAQAGLLPRLMLLAG